MPPSSKRDFLVLAVSTLMWAGVFVSDLLTQRGVASGMLYVVPVMVTLWSRSLRTTPIVAGVCVVLTLIGFFVSSSGVPPSVSITNRAIAMVTIAAVAVVCMTRKSARAALERANGQLESQAEALGAANEQLAQSNTELAKEVKHREQAEITLLRSNRELEEFAYVASHDLQAPLRHVISYLKLIELECSQRLDEKPKEYIAEATRSAKHMQALIQDLLTLARLDSRKQPAKLVDCNVVFKFVLDLLDPLIKESLAEITHDPLPTVTGVESQLLQVLQNLVGNALKYRNERPPAVHVSASSRDGMWVFCVRDNGIGIDPKHVEDVFKLFRRLHSGNEFPGTGIGLALCQRIVERHGGRIWIEKSSPGAGSTFCFSLPESSPNNNVAA